MFKIWQLIKLIKMSLEMKGFGVEGGHPVEICLVECPQGLSWSVGTQRFSVPVSFCEGWQFSLIKGWKISLDHSHENLPSTILNVWYLLEIIPLKLFSLGTNLWAEWIARINISGFNYFEDMNRMAQVFPSFLVWFSEISACFTLWILEYSLSVW